MFNKLWLIGLLIFISGCTKEKKESDFQYKISASNSDYYLLEIKHDSFFTYEIFTKTDNKFITTNKKMRKDWCILWIMDSATNQDLKCPWIAGRNDLKQNNSTKLHEALMRDICEPQLNRAYKGPECNLYVELFTKKREIAKQQKIQQEEDRAKQFILRNNK